MKAYFFNTSPLILIEKIRLSQQDKKYDFPQNLDLKFGLKLKK
jgi:hypothetical protein